MLSCVWYVTFKNAWETSVLGCIADELRKFDVNATIYTEGGTEGLESLDVLSWNSLRPLEKVLIVTGKAKLWHLWESENSLIPFWWGVVRSRARTMHTKLANAGKWFGHPSLMSRAISKSGESIIPPALEAMVESSEAQNWLPNADEITLESGSVSDALLGAYASLQGIKVIAPSSDVLDEILGRNGYIRNDDGDNSGAGVNPSGAARRHIQDKFQPAESAKKLAGLYRKMLGTKE